jgi:uncharacterized protein (DUF1330 family)
MLPTYIIVNVDVRDADKYNEYRRLVPATLSQYQANYLVRGGKFEVLEGTVPYERLVIMRFPSWEQARAWYRSKEYGAIKSIRLTASRGNMFMIEGNAAVDLGESPGFYLGMTKVHDIEKMAEYRPLAMATLTDHGAKILAGSGRIERMEGEEPAAGNILIAFDSFAAAKAWYEAPDYAGPKALRLAASAGSALIAEGL